METSLKERNLLPEGANSFQSFPLRAVSYGKENQFTTLGDLPWMLLYYANIIYTHLVEIKK